MNWYECRPLTDCAAPTLRFCAKEADGRVIFFDGTDVWVRLSADKARTHFDITGKLNEARSSECSSKLGQLATSCGGSKNDTISTSDENEESDLPGPPA